MFPEVSFSELRPIGRVVSERMSLHSMPLGGRRAEIEVFAPYRPALAGLSEYSHLWVISWFHLAERDRLRNHPRRVNRVLPEYGVFALRSPSRPNPIALTLALIKDVRDDRVLVEGMDAVDGTPVLDLKPYNSHDSVFTVHTPWFCPETYEERRRHLRSQALLHHQEECLWVEIAIGIAMVAEDRFGYLQQEDLTLEVRGPACVADILQGLSRARLANPPRFAYTPDERTLWVRWDKAGAAAEWGPVSVASLLDGEGVVAPMPEAVAFEHSVDLLPGTVVTDPESVRRAIVEGAYRETFSEGAHMVQMAPGDVYAGRAGVRR